MRARHLREEGFGLVELLIALTVLAIALFASLAAFSAGAAALARSARVSTGSALSDKQLELYRGIAWSSIGLCVNAVACPAAPATDATYQGDSAYDASAPAGSCTSTAQPECDPSRVVTGPDGRSYRVDSYVTLDDNGTLSRPVKRVTVVVRDPTDLSAAPYARQISTFDELG